MYGNMSCMSVRVRDRWDGDSQTKASLNPSTMRSEGAAFSQLQTAFRITFAFLMILLKVTPHLQSAWKCLLSTQMRRINLQGASLFVCLFLFICSVRLMRACYRYLLGERHAAQLCFWITSQITPPPPPPPSWHTVSLMHNFCNPCAQRPYKTPFTLENE